MHLFDKDYCFIFIVHIDFLYYLWVLSPPLQDLWAQQAVEITLFFSFAY